MTKMTEEIERAEELLYQADQEHSHSRSWTPRDNFELSQWVIASAAAAKRERAERQWDE